MKKMMGILLLCVLLGAGCTREVIVYESKRPKTADMEDALILEMKQEMAEVATEAIEASENAATEEPETEEATESAQPATERPTTENADADPYEVLLTDDVNMRSGPGDEFGILYGLTEGDVVEITGEITNDSGGDWYEITYFGESGYAYKETLDLAGQLLEQ